MCHRLGTNLAGGIATRRPRPTPCTRACRWMGSVWSVWQAPTRPLRPNEVVMPMTIDAEACAAAIVGESIAKG